MNSSYYSFPYFLQVHPQGFKCYPRWLPHHWWHMLYIKEFSQYTYSRSKVSWIEMAKADCSRKGRERPVRSAGLFSCICWEWCLCFTGLSSMVKMTWWRSTPYCATVDILVLEMDLEVLYCFIYHVLTSYTWKFQVLSQQKCLDICKTLK